MANKCKCCGKKQGMLQHFSDGLCPRCYGNVSAEEQQRHLKEEAEQEVFLSTVASVLVTTETAASDLLVQERLGVVTAEVVIGMHMFKDISVGLRNTVGGRSETYQKDLREMRKQALAEIKLEAAELGANAVIAMDLDYQEIGSKGSSMLMLVASGTAVKLTSTGAQQ
ncbi:YbjQ family protein [Tateyamaria sp.]|uniref:YbjQ family protein n=1 Tax=Tateyamaria sp. TaxID=1929288 RepID=UPI00329AF235